MFSFQFKYQTFCVICVKGQLFSRIVCVHKLLEAIKYKIEKCGQDDSNIHRVAPTRT